MIHGLINTPWIIASGMLLCVATLGLGLPPPRSQWCARVREARAGVPPQLHVEVPCETMEATSVAVVSYLCDSLPVTFNKKKTSQIAFEIGDYTRGLAALGTSLRHHVPRSLNAHRLLLVRQGVVVPPAQATMLRRAGWQLGSVPTLRPRHMPSFLRFKNTYSKLALLGMTEYTRILFMDADTLAGVGTLLLQLLQLSHKTRALNTVSSEAWLLE